MHHPANKTELSVIGGDAALRQIIVTTCYYYYDNKAVTDRRLRPRCCHLELL